MPKEPVQLEDSSCCCTATAMEEEVQISEASDTAGASEDVRSPPQSAHSGKRNGRGSAARASVIRNRVIQKKYLQRKKVPLLVLSCSKSLPGLLVIARASVIRIRVIQKKYLQRKKVPLVLSLPSHSLHLEKCAEFGITRAYMLPDTGAQML